MCNDQLFCDYGFSAEGRLYFVVMNADNLLSLDELTNEVKRLLQDYGLFDAQQDHRVSPVPDLRTIRYYTSLGLVDRPIPDPPRQAKYKMRHVWQLLAIKALQGAQLSLADVQSRLYGLSESELKALVETVKSSIASTRRPAEDVHPIIWREFVVAPGLKVMVADGWTFNSDVEKQLIEEKLRAVLETGARTMSPKRTNGGTDD